MMTNVLTWRTRLQVWLRLIVLQASWNFEWLQGTGFIYAICPALKQLYPDSEDLKAACQRHACYFNTHPYLAPLVVGAVLRLEEERAAGKTEQYISISEFKDMVAAPCAAIGDALFWGGLRPLVAGITLFFAIKGILWAPLIYLVLYNLVPLWFRTFFFVRGYRQGIRSVDFLQRYKLPDWAIHTKETAIIVLGGLSAFMVFERLGQASSKGWIGFFALLPVIFIALGARKRISIQLLLYSVVLCIVLLGFVWVELFHVVL
jgi:mannose/fructose/N-acetylgalactosamine-specific phosphotransferase system component IID